MCNEVVGRLSSFNAEEATNCKRLKRISLTVCACVNTHASVCVVVVVVNRSIRIDIVHGQVEK